MYHKSVEKGDSKSAGMGNLFDKSTNHLSPVHLKYFSHWNELIALESKAMQVNMICWFGLFFNMAAKMRGVACAGTTTSKVPTQGNVLPYFIIILWFGLKVFY